MPTAYKTIYDELKRAHAGDLEKAKADNTSFYSTQANSTNKLYDEKVDKQSKAYEDSYRENAIQKLINERQVAENMANLGLTNSGLNRTQQTAVQLSYANNKAGIDRQKQSAISDLNLARTQALDTIEQKRLADEASIIQNYENMLNKSAQSIYEEQIKAENEEIAKIQKEQEEIAKQKKSDYKNVRSYVADSLKTNDDKLTQIYNYATDYDLDLNTVKDMQGNLDIANSSFLNPEISQLLRNAGISESDWKLYVMEKNGYKIDLISLAKPTTSGLLRNYSYKRGLR